MAENKRDDFTIKTKRVIASKVGYRCSMPNCRKFTASPDYKDDDSLNLGIASHITAARDGGPRYDPNMTPEERKHESNGIWLCKDCADIIDKDKEAYSTQTLLNFKRWAENKAKSESRVKEDGIKPITNELINVTDKLNSFIYEYESNDPSVQYWKKIHSPRLCAICDGHYRERDRLKKEYSSKMSYEFEKTILLVLKDVLYKCRVLLGESDEKVIGAYEKLDTLTITEKELREMRDILYDLKSEIEWR